jgi:hypothetical protein
MRIQRLLAACAMVLALAPSHARADTFFSPFIGANFGGDVGTPLNVVDLADRNRVSWGFGFGSMGGGVFGAELDLGYTSKFYTDADDVENNVLTIMPALLLGIPIGGQEGFGFRPYFVGGIGLIRRDVDLGTLGDVSTNDVGYTLGGGFMGFLGDHFGIRGDVRYFRNFEGDELDVIGIDFESGTFSFGRASAGVVFRF